MKSIQRLAQEALEVQDACNPVAVANSFSQAVKDLRETLASLGYPDDHPALLNHPILIMWVNKLESMWYSEAEGRFTQAYVATELLAYPNRQQ